MNNTSLTNSETVNPKSLKSEIGKYLSNISSKEESFYISETMPEDRLNALNDIYNQNLQNLQSFLLAENEKKESQKSKEEPQKEEEIKEDLKSKQSDKKLTKSSFSDLNRNQDKNKSLRENKLSVNMNRITNFTRKYFYINLYLNTSILTLKN